MGCFVTKTDCEIPNGLNLSTAYQSCKFLKLHYWDTGTGTSARLSFNSKKKLAAFCFCAKTTHFDVIMTRTMSFQALT